MNRMKTSEGEFIEVLPVGSKIKHNKYPELTGIIQEYEYHSAGKLSPIPYNIRWDDTNKAHKLLGMLNIYSGPEHVSLVVQLKE